MKFHEGPPEWVEDPLGSEPIEINKRTSYWKLKENSTEGEIPDPTTNDVGQTFIFSSPCLLWTGAKDKKGYGILRSPLTPSGVTRAHRVAHWIKFGYTPSNIELDHLCRNSSCINPSHLVRLTKSEHSKKSNKDRWDVDRGKS